MKFRKEDMIKVEPISDRQLSEAQEAIDTWEKIKPLFDRPEWKTFIEYVRKEHDRLDRVSTCDVDYHKVLLRKGEVAGMLKFLQIPRILKEKATSGADIVALGLAQNKE